MQSISKQLVIVAAGLAATVLSAGQTRADTGYGYAEQTVSGLKVVLPTGGLISGATTTGSITTASAAVAGIGISTNSPTDTLQAYLLSAPPAPQNLFTKYSTTGGGPQAGDFTRGDAVLSSGANLFTTGISASDVAETFGSTAGGNGLETGTSAWQISGSFATQATSITVAYQYSNDILALVSGNGEAPANAQFGVLISIKDQHGHEVDASPAELNTSIAAPLNGPEFISSGSNSATLSLAGLTAGDTYSIALSGQTQTAAGLGVLPEPTSIGMLLATLGIAARRRRSR